LAKQLLFFSLFFRIATITAAGSSPPYLQSLKGRRVGAVRRETTRQPMCVTNIDITGFARVEMRETRAINRREVERKKKR